MQYQKLMKFSVWAREIIRQAMTTVRHFPSSSCFEIWRTFFAGFLRGDIRSTAKETNKYSYQANCSFVIGSVKVSLAHILCGSFALSKIKTIYQEAVRCRSQKLPGRSFPRKKNKAIGRSHFNNQKVAF